MQLLKMQLAKRFPTRYLTKNFKVFLLVLFFIYFVNFFLNNDHNQGSKNDKNSQIEKSNEIVDFKIIDNDVEVNLKEYLSDYNSIQSKWKPYKAEFDILNANNKHVRSGERPTKQLNKNEYLILEYTKVFDKEHFCPFFDNSGAESAKKEIFIPQCPYTNCIFTCDKSLINKVDSILFHESDLKKDVLKDKNYLNKLLNKIKNRKDQIWVLWNDEANPVKANLNEFHFNWTMSYRLDAEVSDCSYGCTYSIPSAEYITNQEEIFKSHMRIEFEKRRDAALWYVSNCKSVYRIDFASKLKDFFDLDVYGSCAKWICSSKESYIGNFIYKLFERGCERSTKCEFDQFHRYKFYLSFESKNCTNYLTEKLWRILRTDMIPVVIQPNKEFYELQAPPNSFIHAQDFDYDPQRLANYLHEVSTNFDLYLKHLKWKMHLNVVFTAKQVEARRMCEFCTKLNTEKAAIYYEKISDWFGFQCVEN